MADDLSIAGRLVALDEVTLEGATKLVPRDKVGFGGNGAYKDVDDLDGSRLPVDSPTLAGKLDLVVAALTALGGYSDQLEPLLTSLGVNTDGLEGLLAHGTYGYAAGTAAGTVDVPIGARVKRVSVIAGSGTATVTIAAGATITIPAGGSFDEQIPGDAPAGADVVIGGTVSSYYVGWVA
jgi:hypothetical protein